MGRSRQRTLRWRHTPQHVIAYIDFPISPQQWKWWVLKIFFFFSSPKINRRISFLLVVWWGSSVWWRYNLTDGLQLGKREGRAWDERIINRKKKKKEREDHYLCSPLLSFTILISRSRERNFIWVEKYNPGSRLRLVLVKISFEIIYWTNIVSDRPRQVIKHSEWLCPRFFFSTDIFHQVHLMFELKCCTLIHTEQHLYTVSASCFEFVQPF